MEYSNHNRLLRPIIKTAILMAMVFGGQSVWAAPDLSVYGALPAVSMMRISPDAELIAFRKQSDGRDLVVAVSLKDGKFVQGVDVSDIKVRALNFFNENKLVIRTAEHRRVLGYRDSFDVSTAFLFDVETGKLSQLLTPGDNIYKGQSGLGRIVGMSKDKRYVYMPAFVPESDTDQSPDFSLMKVELDSPRYPAVLQKGENYTEDYFVDGSGNLIAEERFKGRSRYHSILTYNEGGEKEIYGDKTPIPNIVPVGVMPDAQSLVVADTDESIDHMTYRTMNLADGKLSAPIFARDDADVEGTLADINRVVYGVVYSGLRPSYEFFDDTLNERVAAIVARYPGHSVWIDDWTPDWKHLVVRVEGPQFAGDYWLYSDDGKSRFLASARPDIKQESINPVIEFQYQARDGMKIPALVTIPAHRRDNLQNLPAVMLPHGGPESHDWVEFHWIAQALASRGYLVMQPQFRGSYGFGAAHRRAGRGEWGKKMQDDVSDGLAALVKDKLVDPARVCIMGTSYGGYSALAGGAFTPDLYKCVVSINGVADLEEMLDEEKHAHGREHWVVAYWEDLMAKGKADDEMLRSVSPANSAAKFQAAVLLIHGEDDTVVPFEQARIMRKQLRRADKEVSLIALDDEDHYLSRTATRLQALKTAVAFVDEHIGVKRPDS